MSFPLPVDPAAQLWSRVGSQEMESIQAMLNDTPVRIGDIAKALGIDVVSITLSPDVSGLIKKLPNFEGEYQIQVNNTDAAVRQRFTVAHEISHYLLHRSLIDTDGITDTILYRSKLSDRKEAEANKLAAAILLPWTRVTQWHRENFGGFPARENIDEIAKAFKVSSLAVGFRFGF